MIKLLLVRHGLTEWNEDGRFQGQTDIPLNPTGQKQAQALGKRLALEPMDVIFTSDLGRAVETAKAIYAYHTCPVVIDPRLREIKFGAWEGQTYAEIERHDAERLHAWETRNPQASGPGGETLDELGGRVQSFLDDLARTYLEKTVLIVAHGGMLNVMLCLLLGLAPNRYWQFRLSQASLTEVKYSPPGAAVLYHLNDTCHLNG
jgi:2,3-bisphosphoglycerate-dependent phosphoglycerate mutase